MLLEMEMAEECFAPDLRAYSFHKSTLLHACFDIWAVKLDRIFEVDKDQYLQLSSSQCHNPLES